MFQSRSNKYQAKELWKEANSNIRVPDNMWNVWNHLTKVSELAMSWVTSYIFKCSNHKNCTLYTFAFRETTHNAFFLIHFMISIVFKWCFVLHFSVWYTNLHMIFAGNANILSCFSASGKLNTLLAVMLWKTDAVLYLCFSWFFLMHKTNLQTNT